MNPKIEYSIHDVFDFFSEEIEIIKKRLKKKVLQEKMKDTEARRILDMYLSAQIHLQVSIALTEEDKIKGCNSYTLKKKKAKGEINGSPNLHKIARTLYG